MDKHQLAGFDERERGFCRPVEIEPVEGGVRAILRYETLRIVTEAQETQTIALQELVRMLQIQGYSQLRSQLTVRNGAYLGSQEPWIEFPDPERKPDQSGGWFGKLRRCFQRRHEETHG
jgi:hypothetical protein